MIRKFDKSIMFNNIAFILKRSGRKIGEFENDIGVSPGYISRMNKEEKSKPGIDVIIKAAEILNVSIDTLLLVDIENKTPTEEYLISFLRKLIDDTTDDKLDWNVESADYLNYKIEVDKNGYCNHPLFNMESFTESRVNEDHDEVTRIVFKSQAFNVHTWIDGNCYNLRLKNDTILYIMKICKSQHHFSEKNVHIIEIWIRPKNDSNQFICGTNNGEEISRMIGNLYTVISENTKHPKIKQGIKYYIDAFMNDDFEDDEDLPF